MRTVRQSFARQLQRGNRLLTRHSRKRVEKRLPWIAGCEIAVLIVQRRTSADEYRFAAENVRVEVNDARNGGHDEPQCSRP